MNVIHEKIENQSGRIEVDAYFKGREELFLEVFSPGGESSECMILRQADAEVLRDALNKALGTEAPVLRNSIQVSPERIYELEHAARAIAHLAPSFGGEPFTSAAESIAKAVKEVVEG